MDILTTMNSTDHTRAIHVLQEWKGVVLNDFDDHFDDEITIDDATNPWSIDTEYMMMIISPTSDDDDDDDKSSIYNADMFDKIVANGSDDIAKADDDHEEALLPECIFLFFR